MREEVIGEDSIQVDKAARADRYWIVKKLASMAKRKTWPRWGVATEVMLMALLPHYRYKDRRLGLGAEGRRLEAPVFSEMWLEMLRKIRRAEATPLAWHCSQGIVIPKMNMSLRM
eukprot:2160021-Lingulodinium_polyedra.AAC.1